jgi:threonine dehydratase
VLVSVVRIAGIPRRPYLTVVAGNHAQGVALSGQKLDIPCTIVMPKGTPTIKVRNVSRLGAKVVLHGNDFDEAKAECARLAEAHGLTFVPPYDDPLVIAGQGTVGLEILKQIPEADELDGIFAAVGGGGLVSGISAYVKRIGDPKTKVVGVETFDGDAMERSLQTGERVTLKEVGPFSDGTAVKIVGAEPFRMCKTLVDGVVKVDTDEICAAIKDVFEGSFIRRYHYACADSYIRDQIHHRACRSARSRWPETIHHAKWITWRKKTLCGRGQRSEHEF